MPARVKKMQHRKDPERHRQFHERGSRSRMMAMARDITVIKVGGSLLASGRLEPMLNSIVAGAAGRAVVVPGGGLFADAVRQAQRLAGFDDVLAHRLAIDAMGQMAHVVAAASPTLKVVADATAIRAALEDGLVPVWQPSGLRAGHPAIEESWDVTSDSLALWLAAELGAASLVLVKSADPLPNASPEELASCGLVDAAFPKLARRFRGRITVHGPAAGDDLSQALAGAEAASA
jgi:aspartokinase-like uncharacterized kinase